MTLTTESLGLLVCAAPVDEANDTVLEVIVTPTTESLGLLVCTAPVDDTKDPILEVLRVGRCSVRTLYRF